MPFPTPSRIFSRPGALVLVGLLALISVTGPALWRGYGLEQAQRAHWQAQYQQWVTWRGQHCQFHGDFQSLGSDPATKPTWVCDNGKEYRATYVRPSIRVYLIPTRWWSQYHPHEPLDAVVGYDG
jgi:hypothetical protein